MSSLEVYAGCSACSASYLLPSIVWASPSIPFIVFWVFLGVSNYNFIQALH